MGEPVALGGVRPPKGSPALAAHTCPVSLWISSLSWPGGLLIYLLTPVPLLVWYRSCLRHITKVCQNVATTISKLKSSKLLHSCQYYPISSLRIIDKPSVKDPI